MMKYLLYFLVSVNVFLISGSSVASENQQKCERAYTMHAPDEDIAEYDTPKADIERYGNELYNRKHPNNVDNAHIRLSSPFRNNTAYKHPRTSQSPSTERTAWFIRTWYPKERQTSFSFRINPLKFSYGYYIYTLRRILI